MDIQKNPNAQSLSNKQAMADFVHDVADMEVRAFSMREAAKKVRGEAKNKQQQLENNIRSQQIKKEKEQNKYDEENVNIIKYRSWNKYFDRYHGNLVKIWVVPMMIVVGMFLFLILFGLNMSKNERNVMMIITPCIIVGWNLIYGLPVVL